jgi:5'(3')-deoxyribonucleotidase
MSHGKGRQKKKVHCRSTPKYTTSNDEGSSRDNEDDLISLFANLNMEQKKKLNELIETINEKDDLLECQEDLLVKENKKFVKLKNAYALEVEKCENLFKELSMCNDSISCLRNENASLVSKIEKLNACNDSISFLRDENASLNAKINELNTSIPSTSTVENVSICTRCRDVNIEAIDDHLAMIKQQNDHIANLNAKIAEHELENENFKFARSMLYNGRHPGIKDGIGFQLGNQSNVKLNAPKKLSNFVKGKAPMVQDSEGYILCHGEFMLGNLILFLIMHLCIKMRLLVLGIQLISKCLIRKLLMHQMSITFHLKLLMLLMCSLTNQAK